MVQKGGQMQVAIVLSCLEDQSHALLHCETYVLWRMTHDSSDEYVKTNFFQYLTCRILGMWRCWQIY